MAADVTVGDRAARKLLRMFGTLGFSELIIILVIVLIIFGAGRLPQIGEGLGKALKGFKKEVHEVPPPVDPNAAAAPTTPQTAGAPPTPIEDARIVAQPQGTAAPTAAPAPASAPYQPGPELTPGTTAALMAAARPQMYEPPKPKAPRTPAAPAAAAQPAAQPHPIIPTMEERLTQPPPPVRAAYPPLPPGAQPKPVPKRPSAIVNKDAVARVQAQQAALKAKATQPVEAKAADAQKGLSPQDMQSLGEGIGDALRTFRQAVADVRNSVDPQMRTIQAEMDAAQKEIEQSIEAAKPMPAVQEAPPEKT